jgi:hypothetical protein
MNPSSAADSGLPAMIGGLARSHQQIDRTFNTVAERLGDGLTLFEGLKSSFGDLSRELAGEDMDATRAMLTRLGAELRAFGDALPAETATLQAMTADDAKTSKAFVQLREHLQLIAVLARSTRIEAASLTSYREDISSFTSKIITLTGQAKESIDECLRTYGRLTALLNNALSQQREFSQRYRGSLQAVAGKLINSVTVLGSRATKGSELMTDAAERARQLSAAVGGAIVSMQSGDNIRQRLEHVVTALDLIPEPAGGGSDADPLGFVIKRLQTLQLREAAEVLRDEVRGIDSALAMLEHDSQAMVDLGRKLFSGDDASANSFMDGLYADLADASALIEKCDAARNVVDQATRALTNMVEITRQTEAGFSETIQDIVMIGTNAGLLAGRLGISGRGLVVIANEVKAVASLIVRDASLLGPLFAHLQATSQDLLDRDHAGATDMGSLDKSIREALGRMRISGTRLESALKRLATDAGDFGVLVSDCRRSFADLSTATNLVETSSAQLDRETSGAAQLLASEAADIEETLKTRVLPTYTMSAERDIYRHVLKDLGLLDASSASETLSAAE